MYLAQELDNFQGLEKAFLTIVCQTLPLDFRFSSRALLPLSSVSLLFVSLLDPDRVPIGMGIHGDIHCYIATYYDTWWYICYIATSDDAWWYTYVTLLHLIYMMIYIATLLHLMKHCYMHAVDLSQSIKLLHCYYIWWYMVIYVTLIHLIIHCDICYIATSYNTLLHACRWSQPEQPNTRLQRAWRVRMINVICEKVL